MSSTSLNASSSLSGALPMAYLFRHAALREKDRRSLTRRLPDDFLARSSDELSLAKGDRVELIERDDEFGDGWFLGKHLVNGNSGLFPEGLCDFAQRQVPPMLTTI